MKSNGEDNLLSSNSDVENRSDDASNGIDISDKESSDQDVPSTYITGCSMSSRA